MVDRELMAIADGISERLWRASLDRHEPERDRFVVVTRPYRGAGDRDHGEWFVQILLVGGANANYCSVTVGVCGDGSVRAYHPEPQRHVVGAWAVSVLGDFDAVADGLLAGAMRKEDPISQETAARIVAHQRERRRAA